LSIEAIGLSSRQSGKLGAEGKVPVLSEGAEDDGAGGLGQSLASPCSAFRSRSNRSNATP